MVFVDFDLMREAPAHLLRGGIGDVFTCHTARWDWEYAVARGHDPAWDDFAAAESLRIVAQLHDAGAGDPGAHRRRHRGPHGAAPAHRQDVRRLRARALRGGLGALLRVLLRVRERAHHHARRAGHARRPHHVDAPGQPAGVRARDRRSARASATDPDELGITWAEIDATLRELPAFVVREGLWYTIANDLVVGDRELALARDALDF